MNALIIGPGYVGKALVLELRSRGHEVTALRRSDAPDPEMQSAGVDLIQADISRPGTLPNPPNYEWVINCAASSLGGVEDYRRTYLEGARNILAWLRGSGIRKYVYTSSTGVYGQHDGSIVDEQSPIEPETDTGKVLVETEQALLQAGSTFPAVILRVAGIYGPGRGYWVRQFLSGEARIEGDGSRILNMIHRDDVVGAIIAALERSGPREVYNVVDNEPVSQRVMFKWLASRLNRPLPPSSSESPRRSRGVTNKLVSSRKLQAQLGFQFKYPTFREGFENLTQ